MPHTITTPGTTGNQTINKAAGRVNIAVSGTTVTVTNNLVTANSHVYAWLVTDDATATGIKSVVPGSGSFVINLNAAATAEVAIGFVVFNGH
jgi:ethanolamine utilization microcompartment shell protein EutS